MTLLFIYLIVAVGVSFLCSLLESVILSVSPAYIAVLEKDNPSAGTLLSDLKDNIDRPLAAILTLNTVAHTFGAAGVGAEIQKIYGNDYLTASSIVLTLVILIFSEIIPKTIGAVHSKKLAGFCAKTTNLLIYITYPFVVLSEFLHDILDSSENATITREEMIVTAEIGVDEGTIQKNESLVIRNLMLMKKITVSDIMTPRSVIFAIDGEKTIGQVFKENSDLEFSRIPVFKETLDQVIGVALRYKLMDSYSKDLDNLKVESLAKPIHSIPETISVSACLDQFIKRKEHIFLVVNEYGTPDGIVSLEDVVETLLGVEIVDEFDSVEDMRKYARELWQERKRSLVKVD